MMTVYAGWTDPEGCGPDVVGIDVRDWPPPEVATALTDPERHRAVHLVVMPDPEEGYVSNAPTMFNGAFALGREQAAELYRQLGEWLAKYAEGGES